MDRARSEGGEEANEMEGEERGGGAGMATNWRKEADENLKRLHSLLFGADLALDRGDPDTARTLALRLLGFLHSRTHTPVDAAFVAPIMAQASSMLAAASRALAPDSDR